MEGKRNLINAKCCNYIQLQFSEQACVKYIKISFYLVYLTSSSNERRHPHGNNVLCVPTFPLLCLVEAAISGNSDEVGCFSTCRLTLLQPFPLPAAQLPAQFFPSPLLACCMIPVSPGSLHTQGCITFTLIRCLHEANLDHC